MVDSKALATVKPDLLTTTCQPRSGFLAGLSAPFRGLSFLAKRPGLWLYSLVPAAIAFAIVGSLSAVSVRFIPGLIQSLFPVPTSTLSTVGVVAAAFAATAIAIVLALVIGLKLAQPLSGPVLERLARAMELELGVSKRPVVPLWREITRSIAGNLLGLSIGLPILIVLTGIGFFFPISAVLVIPMQFLVTGMMVTWDLLDYPFSIRGYRIGFRANWIRQNPWASIGFGLSLGLVFLVPCMQVLLLPAGTVGATWLVFEREQLGRGEKL